MATQTEIDLALMAGYAYHDTRTDINRFPVPLGWNLISRAPQSTSGSGFEAYTFQRGTEIVISFAGTGSSGDMGTNVALWLGMAADQLREGAAYYLSVKAANPDAVISFTGHSLGGGLASLLGAFFGEKAVTFDQAPFASAANVTNAQIIKDYLATLSGGGFVTGAAGNTPALDNALASLDAFINAADPAQTLADRVANISNIYVQGEVLSTAPFGSSGKLVSGIPTQLDQTSITMQPFGLSSADLHSQALLTTFLQSPCFEAATAKLPDLLPLIFDSKMYKREVGTNQQNFLEMLVQSEATTTSGQSQLDYFSIDMATLGTKQNWPSIINDINQGNLARALMAFAMQMYYENTALAQDKKLFSNVAGGVQFDSQDVSATMKDSKGYVQYFKSYLNNLSNSDRALVEQLIPAMRDWYVQAGATGMNTTDTQNRAAFMLGGNGSDSLTGGNGNDLLVGNAGNDLLQGGQGNDTLLGGAGNDTYIINTGPSTGSGQAGNDTIEDKQGSNTVIFNGQSVTMLFRQTDGTYKTAAGTITGAMSGTDLVLTDTVNGGTLTLNKDFTEGDFGIKFYDQPVDPVLTTYGSGTAAAEILIGSGEVYGRGGNDIILGSTGIDIMQGDGGNDTLFGNDVQITIEQAILNGNTDAATNLNGDWLAGGTGDDVVVAGINSDILAGGGGNDLLIAGAGDDFIYGDVDFNADTGTGGNILKIEQLPNGAWKMTAPNLVPDPADSGNDTLYAGNGADYVWAGQGNDVVYGEAGNDIIDGQAGNDILFGGDGLDQVWGGDGSDTLLGGAGADTLSGDNGDGTDLLNGGAGRLRNWNGVTCDVLFGLEICDAVNDTQYIAERRAV